MPAASLTLLAALFGLNLIGNPGAEPGEASSDGFEVVGVPAWTTGDGLTVVDYGNNGDYIKHADPGPPDRGNHFFAGGAFHGVSWAEQSIDLTAVAAEIDSGHVTYVLGGWLGGLRTQRDHAVLNAHFLGEFEAELDSVALGPVGNVDRGNLTALLERSHGGVVPPGTRHVLVRLDITYFVGLYNDGYADNLSFVLSSVVPVRRATWGGVKTLR